MARAAVCLAVASVALCAADAAAQLREYTLAGGSRFSAMTVDRAGDAVGVQGRRLRLVQPDGRSRVITSAIAGSVSDVAALPDGRYALAQPRRSRVLVVDGTGKITTLAGTGVPGYRGDGGPGSAAQLDEPGWLATLGDGTLAIADAAVIRGLDAQGIMRPLVGQPPCLGGEGGPASGAQIETPTAIAALPDGGVVFGQFGCVRRVAADGTVTTPAGTGVLGPYMPSSTPGDSVAAQTPLSTVSGIAVLPDGTIVFSDEAFVRRITPDGRLSVVAGCTGTCASAPTVGAAATSVSMGPAGLSARPDGTILIGDTRSSGVIEVAPDGSIAAVHRFSVQGYGGSLPVAATVDGGFVAGAPDGVVRVAPDGTETTVERSAATAVAVLPDGDVAVGNSSELRVLTPDGTFVRGYPGGAEALAAAPDGALVVGAGNRLTRIEPAATTVLAGNGTAPGNLGAAPDDTAWGPGPLAPAQDGTLLFLTGRGVDVTLHRRAADGSVHRVATLAVCKKGCPFEPGELPPGISVTGAPDGGAYLSALGSILHLGHGPRTAVARPGSLGFFGSGDGSTAPVRLTADTADLEFSAGDLLFLEGGRLRLLAGAGTKRLAVAIPRATLRAAAARRIAVAVTQPARVVAQARRGGRILARAAVTIRHRAGSVRLPSSLAAGEYSVRIVAHGLRDRSATAMTQHRLVLGGELPLATARRLVRRAGLPSFGRSHGADFSPVDVFAVRGCRRVLATRVDCEVSYYVDGADYTEEECYLQAVTLRRSGVVTLRAYGRRPKTCAAGRLLPLQARPGWDSPTVQAPPL